VEYCVRRRGEAHRPASPVVSVLDVVPVEDLVDVGARFQQRARVSPAKHHHRRAEPLPEQRAEREREHHVADAIGTTDEDPHAAGLKKERIEQVANAQATSDPR
jgi:hypothetical protein